jgi:hypothetical protein
MCVWGGRGVGRLLEQCRSILTLEASPQRSALEGIILRKQVKGCLNNIKNFLRADGLSMVRVSVAIVRAVSAIQPNRNKYGRVGPE